MVLFLLALTIGCEPIETACPVDPELTPYLEQGVEYWAADGRAIVLTDNGCSVHVHLSDKFFDGGEWPKRQKAGLYRDQLWLNRTAWSSLTEAEKRFVLTHELGHIWTAKHSTGVMQASVPSDLEISKLFQ